MQKKNGTLKAAPATSPKLARITQHLSEIQRVKEWVEEYTHNSCDEFMEIGNVSRHCHDLSWQTLEAVGRALALSNGIDPSSPLSKAHTTLSGAIEAIGGEIERYSGASDELRKALRDLPRIEKLNSALSDPVAPFRNLRVASGIDLARLDAKSERELAVLLEGMAALHERSTAAYETQAVRLKDARNVVLALDIWVTERVKALSDASGRTQELLEEIKRVPGAISAVTGRLLQHMDEISRKTGELVVSLQTDDAVRQNLEHVCAMLDEIAASFAGMSHDGAAGANEEIKWFIHEASAIQLRQIGGIQHKVSEAGERITGALAVIVARIADISSEAMNLTSSATETSRQQSTMTHLQAVLESIEACFSDPPVVNAEFYRDMDALPESDETSVDPARKALLPGTVRNPTIGQQKESIELLSDQARQAFDENRHVAGEVFAGLNRLAGLSRRFAAEIVVAAAVQQSQQRELERVSNDLPHELAEVRRRVSSELKGVCEQCHGLQHQTLELLKGIQFIDSAEKGLQAITNLLEAIVSDTETALTAESVSKESALLLDSLRGRYTMDNERMLHDGVGGDSSDYGDDVELF